MTVPAAPLEANGDKVLFLVYDNTGSNAAALIRAIAQGTLNAETVAHMAVATQVDGATHGASAPLVMIGGSDGTVTRKALVDASGRLLIGGEVVDNAAFADGTTRIVPAGYIFDEAAGTALTENDAGAARMDSKRAVVYVLEDTTTRGRRQTVLTTGGAVVAGDVSDNAAFTDGTTHVVPVGYIYDEVAGTALTENDAGVARMDVKRAVVTVLEDKTTRGQRQAVSATGAALVDNEELPAASALADGTANPTTTLIGAGAMVFNGATWDRARTPTVFKAFSGTVITSETSIWTPTSGKKFRLMGFVVTQTVVAGDITIRDGTGLATILTIPSTPTGQPLAVPLGNGILSGAINRVLTMQGASTEAVSGFVYGTEE